MSNLTSLSNRLIILLAAASALGPAAMQILLPAVPIIKDTFQVSNDIAQLTLSLSMFAIAIGTLVYGPLSDKYGRRVIMLLGLVITFAGSMFCYFSTSIELLILGRFIQAFGGAVGLVLDRAIVRDIYGAEEAARVIATVVMVMVVIPMLSPAVGGELMNQFGWQSIFIAIALLCILILMLSINYLPETLKEPVPFEGVRAMLLIFFRLFKSPAYCGYAFCVTFVSVVFFSFISAAPEIMVSVLDRPPTEYGYYFIMVPLGFMLGNYVTRYFGHRLELNQLITWGGFISVLGITLAFILLSSGIKHPLALFAPIAVSVFGNGITLPNAMAAAINEFPNFAGSASGLTGFLQMGFSAVAAQVVALIFNGTVYPLLLMMFAAAILSLVSLKLGVSAERHSGVV